MLLVRERWPVVWWWLWLVPLAAGCFSCSCVPLHVSCVVSPIPVYIRFSCVVDYLRWFIPNCGANGGNIFLTFLYIHNSVMPIYVSKRALVCTIPALALTSPPSLAGILDNLEGQIGADIMKKIIVNIMQQSSKSFILHSASADQVNELMAQGLNSRGHLLETALAKNTTIVVLDRVPYDLPEAALTGMLSRYGEVKSIRQVTHKAYSLSKYKIEMARKQDIPSRISVQGNPINTCYKSQPQPCFVCQGAGHKAKTCPRKLANKRAAPEEQDANTQAVNKRAHQVGSEVAQDPPPALPT